MLSNPPQSRGFDPVDHGLASWAYDPSLAGTSLIMSTAGRLFTVRLKVPQPITVTAIRILLSVPGPTLTAGQNFAVLFNEAGTQVGVTADQSTAWAGAAGDLDMPLTASAVLAGPFCTVGFYANGSTLPSFRANSSATAVGNAGLATASSRYGLGTTGLTSTPPATVGTISAPGAPYWVGLR